MKVELKQPKPSHKTFEEIFLRGEAKQFAAALNLSEQLITSWCREVGPGLSGRRNPLDSLGGIVDVIAKNDGNLNRVEPLAQYVARLCGGLFCPLSCVDGGGADLLKHTAAILKKTGHALEVTRVAWFEQSPDELTPKEKSAIYRDVDQAIVALLQLRKWAEGK